VGAVVVGAIAGNQSVTAGDHGAAGSSTHVTAGAPLVVSVLLQQHSTTGDDPTALAHENSAGAGSTVGTSSGANGVLDPGCDGNPTSAPATTPVGPRTAHGQGLSPVTHPLAGGCGPNGIERP
jgi:hypothetical protein